MPRITSVSEIGPRYRVLRAAAVGLTLLGILTFVISIGGLAFGSYVLLASRGGELLSSQLTSVGGVYLVAWSIGGLLMGLQFVVLGALLRLLIHLEENTRATAQALEKIRLNTQPRQVGSESMFRS